LDPENSIQAQLRNLRKPEFGRHAVERRRRDQGNVSEYQLQTSSCSVDATPEVIKVRPLIEYSEGRAKLTRILPKKEWREIDAKLRMHGYRYMGCGEWTKQG